VGLEAQTTTLVRKAVEMVAQVAVAGQELVQQVVVQVFQGKVITVEMVPTLVK
jgi:hypothetical protein